MQRVLVESDPTAVWRHARPRQPSSRLVEQRADRELEARPAALRADYRDASIFGKVGRGDGLDELARCTAAQRHLRERSTAEEEILATRTRGDGHITGS